MKITRAAITEWLCRGGMFTMPVRNRKKDAAPMDVESTRSQ
jgi:hypothetical protein